MRETGNNVKEQIIAIVKAMGPQIGTNVMGNLFDKENGTNRKIGSNQFRSIAAACRQAESFEELELMIAYSIAKAGDRQSWKTICANNETFGALVLKAMQQVRAIDEEKALAHLELFFGYLYWQVRVWADTYGNQPSNREGQYRGGQQKSKYGRH